MTTITAEQRAHIEAEALREAAKSVEYGCFCCPEHGPSPVPAWLRDRADRIEAQP